MNLSSQRRRQRKWPPYSDAGFGLDAGAQHRWLEEHKCRDGKPTKGIIIAAEYDPKIHYSIKKVPDVEVFEYRLKFELVPYEK